MKIIKKDGTVEGWNGEKIKEAVYKAAARVNQYVEPVVLNKLVEKVHSCLIIERDVPTKDLHKEVIHYLKYFGLTDVANSYQEYRDYKNTYAKSFEKVKDEADNVLLLGDRENANFDSSLVSTKGSLIKGYLTKELYRQFYLSKEEKELTKRGDIYIHDMRDMLMGSVNCFSRETTFLTSEGIRSFKDFNNGDQIKVLTHKGNWKTATVHSYGKQPLYKVSVRRSCGEPVEVFVTKTIDGFCEITSKLLHCRLVTSLQIPLILAWSLAGNLLPPLRRLYGALGLSLGMAHKLMLALVLFAFVETKINMQGALKNAAILLRYQVIKVGAGTLLYGSTTQLKCSLLKGGELLRIRRLSLTASFVLMVAKTHDPCNALLEIFKFLLMKKLKKSFMTC